jgi:hypothetical protein
MICYRCGKNMGDDIGACENCAAQRGVVPEIPKTKSSGSSIRGYASAARDVVYDRKHGWQTTPSFIKLYLGKISLALAAGVCWYLVSFFIFYEVKIIKEGEIEIVTGRLGEYVHSFTTDGKEAINGARLMLSVPHPISLGHGDFLLPRVDIIYCNESSFMELSKNNDERLGWLKDSMKKNNPDELEAVLKNEEEVSQFIMMLYLPTNSSRSLTSDVSLLARDSSTLNALVEANLRYGDVLDVTGTSLNYNSSTVAKSQDQGLSKRAYILVDSLNVNGKQILPAL